MTEGNLETKYCGEVIGEGVQLWNKREKTWPETNLETWKQDQSKQNSKREPDRWRMMDRWMEQVYCSYLYLYTVCSLSNNRGQKWSEKYFFLRTVFPSSQSVKYFEF